MTPYEIIEKKRDGKELSEKEIKFFIQGFLNNQIQSYQMTAFLMAVFFSGMTKNEIFSLTKTYINSGKVLDLSDIPQKKIDKHSTGGVGDKVSIVLAPLVASLGITVPMISGRGLGHTGGTLDKLESIPGFQTDISIKQFRKLLKKNGVALIGQSNKIVPADKQIYALRDVTATINSIPLITASIMSKKIAEGIDGLVLDVKCGRGAFMKNLEEAIELSNSLIEIGARFKKEVRVCITSMDQPLGRKIGNWLEIEECLDCFRGEGPPDLLTIIFELASQMLLIGGIADEKEDALQLCKESLSNGQAFDKFLILAEAQGADIRTLKKPEKYAKASETEYLFAEKSGFIAELDAREIGMASVYTGAGRMKVEDPVDYQSGIVLYKKIGDRVNKGEKVMEIRANRSDFIDAALTKIQSSIVIKGKEQNPPKLIIKEIS
jgi:pyrimidine-nucleoside phosphorylase